MKLFSTTLVILLIFSGLLPARGGSAGKTGFEFLRTELSARQTGMGGAFVAVDGDVYGLSCNPASLAGLKRRQAAFSYVDYFMDFQLGFVGYSTPLKFGGTLGTSLSYANYGEFQWTDQDGKPTGSSSPGDILFTVAFADWLSKSARYGVSIKYIRSSIQKYSADAVAVNAGFIYCIPRQQMTFGTAVLNVGKGLNGFMNTIEEVPTSVRLGFTKGLAHLPLMLSFDASKFLHESGNMGNGVYWIAGGEFTVSDRLLLRLGYNSRGSEEKMGSTGSRLSGVSFGLGVHVRNFKIDYSLSNYGALGTVNTVGVASDF
jgi:hypothetical protein